MAKIYKNPNTVTLDSVAVTGVVSISVSPSQRSNAVQSDNGTVTTFLTNMAVTGTIQFNDQKQARALKGKGGDSKDLTFKVLDEAGAETTVTISDCLCGDANVNFRNEAAGGGSIGFHASGVSDPA
jgi:hypothetical protein